MLVHCLPMKSRKGWLLTYLILLPCADLVTHADLVRHTDLVHDITDTDCWAQHSQSCLHVLDADLCFSCWFLTDRGEKCSEKLLCVYLVYSITTGIPTVKSGISKLGGMVSDSLIPARPSFMCSFKQSNIERTHSSTTTKSVWYLCIYDLFYFFARIGFRHWLEKGFMYEKSFEMYICVWQSLIGLRWPCAVNMMLKFSY